MWHKPTIKANITDQQERIEFSAALVRVFVNEDMDTWDIEDVDRDIRAPIIQAAYEISGPERYKKD